MTLLDTGLTLTWRTELSTGSYTTIALYDQYGRRWGWILNAARSDVWTAHSGGWGQHATTGRPTVPIPEDHRTVDGFTSLLEAQAWITQQVADYWWNRATPAALYTKVDTSVEAAAPGWATAYAESLRRPTEDGDPDPLLVDDALLSPDQRDPSYGASQPAGSACSRGTVGCRVHHDPSRVVDPCIDTPSRGFR